MSNREIGKLYNLISKLSHGKDYETLDQIIDAVPDKEAKPLRKMLEKLGAKMGD